MNKNDAMGAVTLACCCLLGASAASAQQAATPGHAGEAPEVLEEVIVSAQKRDESVQKVPISVTAISGAALEARGIADFSAAAKEIPSVALRSSGPGQTEVSMRGLSSLGGKSPVVGFYLDDTVLTPPTGAIQGKVVVDPDLYDLNRIEILRGPQGTLYGASSMGGTIKLVTNQPDPTAFAASVHATSAVTDGGLSWGQSAMINIPLVQDRLALRVVETLKHQSGWIDRVVLSDFPLEQDFLAPGGPPGGTIRGDVLAAPVAKRFKNANDTRLEGVRALLLGQVTDRLTVTPSFFYQRIAQDNAGLLDNPPGSVDAHYQPFDVAEPFSDQFTIYGLTVKYSGEGYDVTSATSYWRRTSRIFQDITETLQWAFAQFLGPASDYSLFGPVVIRNFDKTRQLSEELRISSTGDGPWQWIGGVFADNFRYTTDAQALSPALFQNGFPTATVFAADGPSNLDQRSAFGEMSYQVSGRLKATAGLRWYSYTSDSVGRQSGIVATGSDAVSTSTTHAKHSGFNPKVNLAYTLSDDALLYVTAAKGFRPGGGNSPVPVTGPSQCLTGPGNLQSLGRTQSPLQYEPDEIWSYELGQKAKLLGDRLTVNSSVYYMKWAGVQQRVSLACGFLYSDNAADAEVYGAELELSANVGRGWSVVQTAGYAHSQFVDNVPSTNTTKGQKLTNIPEWTTSTGLGYEMPIAEGRRFTARLTHSYTAEREDITFSRNRLPSYSLVGLRAGVTSSAWSAFVFAENLTDKRAFISNNAALAVDLATLNRVSMNQPRTIGVSLDYHF